MSEEKQVANESVENNATQTNETSNADVSALIAESKKYRKRSQEAESRIQELEAKINSFETDKLKEKEEFKTLYEKVSEENKANKALADKWTNFEATKREELLSKLPDEEKAEWNDSPLNLLDKYVTKMSTPNNPTHVQNQSRKTNDVGDWKKMSIEEKRSNWGAILDSFKN